ncbi:MAG: aminotransferase class I/II-fold pyridoxal phosphate-dependent enzyme [Acidimicrobiales bacterium]
MTSGEWSQRVRAQLDAVIDGGRWRSPRGFDARGPSGRLDGLPSAAPVVSFASNDYLGLSVHPSVVEAAADALARWGAGSGASRLVTGSRPVHAELERALAEWKGTEAAVCFPTGFAANLGVLSVLGGPDVRVLSDELNHASIIDGCRLSRSQVSVYRHGDVEHLGELLAGRVGGVGGGAGVGGGGGGRVGDGRVEVGGGGRVGDGRVEVGGGDRDRGHAAPPTLVVTDTVFSMDGDVAPIEEVAALCRRHGALLLVDEAHAVLGPALSSADFGRDGPTLVRVGTLSKTLGSLGGFVAGPRDVIDLLVNRARPYIFSTALTPADAAAALAALGIVRSPEGEALVSRLRAYVDIVGGPDHPSPIIPVVLGREERALEASARLLDAGLWVPAIRPPTVPEGTSRLRVTLSAAHTGEEVAQLVGALASLRGGVGSGVGTGVGSGVGTGVGSGVGTGVGSGVGTGVGSGVGSGTGTVASGAATEAASARARAADLARSP